MDPMFRVLFLSFIICVSSTASDEDTQCGHARSVGREFVVGFLQTNQMESVNELHLACSSRSHTSVTITAPDVYNEPQETYLTGSKQFTIISLKNMPDMTPTAVLIQSTSDISVIGVVAGNNTGAFLALPVEALGTEYFVATYDVAVRIHRSKRGSEFIVIGTTQETTVQVTFTGSARYAGDGIIYDSGNTVRIKINRLEIARFVSKTDDLTGTHILADQPVAVISGSKCADVPVGTRYCDHLVEQIPPFHFWGSHFVTTPLASRTEGDIFRVIAGRNNTIVTMCDIWRERINAGDVIEKSIPSNKSCAIVSSNPVLVLQYSKGGSVDSSSADPSMMLVPALEQFCTETLFVTVDISPNIEHVSSYLNVVLQCDLIHFLTQDMFSVSPELFRGFSNVSIAGRTMCSAQLPLSESSRYFFQFEDVPGFVSLVLYGNAAGEIATSFGFPVAFSFKNNSCYTLPKNHLKIPATLTKSPDSYTVNPSYIDQPNLEHSDFGESDASGDAQTTQSNLLAVSLIILMVSLIIVTLSLGYVIILRKRVELLESEKRNYSTIVSPNAGLDGYIGLDGSQIAHREYMTLNNAEEMWHMNRRSDRSVFRGIQPAHSIRSNVSQQESVVVRDTVELVSRDPLTPSRHVSQTDGYGNVNPAFMDDISISSHQGSVSEVLPQTSSLRKPIRPVRRHHSHMEGFNTTTPVPKPRYHGPRGLRRSVSTPGEDIFGNPMRVYYHVPRGDPIHPYDRPRNGVYSEGMSPLAAAILLPPEEVSDQNSRKSSSNDSESSLPVHQDDDGYMSMKEAASTHRKNSQSNRNRERESISYSDENHNRKHEPLDEDSTEYTELF